MLCLQRHWRVEPWDDYPGILFSWNSHMSEYISYCPPLWNQLHLLLPNKCIITILYFRIWIKDIDFWGFLMSILSSCFSCLPFICCLPPSLSCLLVIAGHLSIAIVIANLLTRLWVSPSDTELETPGFLGT